MNFSDELIDRIKQKKSCICLGLDPDIDHSNFPTFLKSKHDDNLAIIREFTLSLIDELAEDIVIIKPNLKFYEALGIEHYLNELTQHAHKKDLLVIIDSKGNDILTSMEMHYKAMFNNYNADAITINAYMGEDVISPFDKYLEKGKGLFILVKTSNPSSNDFQDLFSVKLNVDEKLERISAFEVSEKILKRNYIRMAQLVNLWSKRSKGKHNYSSIGAVVGANVPSIIVRNLRMLMQDSFFLMPGYGAQQGLLDSIDSAIKEDKLGAIINSSRGIMYAWNQRFKGKFKDEEYLKAAKEEIKIMKKEINF
ncbi:MAG: orotidine-5'-phosphate decarboxylase [Candidatus Lokiarchaeota archaeon]|nr:orotidine-5'-phosphate decarboxylase [Candidatus Lokiarchaeota archaeon]